MFNGLTTQKTRSVAPCGTCFRLILGNTPHDRTNRERVPQPATPATRWLDADRRNASGDTDKMANIKPRSTSQDDTGSPSRIQRRRAKGWRKPPNAVFVGRPSKWGNPFAVGQHVATNADAVAAYAKWLASNPALLADLDELRGKTLMCWCSLGEPCHAAVLLRLASQPPQLPPIANAGHADATNTHANLSDGSEQGCDVERSKLKPISMESPCTQN